MSKNKSVSIHTLGCRVNMYESCAIAEQLRKRGFEVTKNKDSDYYIINTCAVTAESERKSRQLVRRCASKGRVLVIGCASQLSSEFCNIDNVIYVGGNRNKLDVVGVISEEIKKDVMSVTPMDGAPYEDMSLSEADDIFSECRAFIKIQDGCNGKCTYCIIPKCRGSVRSRDAESIIDEAQNLVNSGYREIILTGIEVSAYNKMPLAELITKVASVKGVERIRLGSLSPKIITDSFLVSVSKLSNFMPHIHLSIQSCCDKILVAMKRPYRKNHIIECVSAIRKYIPDCMISADIIVGFPGETEEDFLETLNTLKELNVFHLHSFPYSEREGTPAATMPNSIPKSVRAGRNSRLIESTIETKKRILDEYIGRSVSVLIEKIIDGIAVGHTMEFLEASFQANDALVGDIVDLEIYEHDGAMLIGRNKEN